MATGIIAGNHKCLSQILFPLPIKNQRIAPTNGTKTTITTQINLSFGLVNLPLTTSKIVNT